MTTPEPSAPEPSEREAFEAAVIALPHRPHARANRILPLDWDDPEPEEGNEGGYAYHATYYAFQLWQARAALKPSPSPVVVEPTAAARDVLAERLRQISAEGWTPDHDDEHHTGDLAKVAAAYAVVGLTDASPTEVPAWFPWEEQWWKPKGHRRNLVKAGALILAEIERLDRASASGSQESGSTECKESSPLSPAEPTGPKCAHCGLPAPGWAEDEWRRGWRWNSSAKQYHCRFAAIDD